MIDPQLPQPQAGFRHGCSTTDQIALLTDGIEAEFQAWKKIGIVLVDLTAAYDTVWLRGLHIKLLCMVPGSHLVTFIVELLTNCSFKLRISDGHVMRLRCLCNSVPQGSTLSPMLFNITAMYHKQHHSSTATLTTSQYYPQAATGEAWSVHFSRK